MFEICNLVKRIYDIVFRAFKTVAPSKCIFVFFSVETLVSVSRHSYHKL